MRTSRQVSEREIALAVVLEFAESGLSSFLLYGYYDDDAEFIDDVAKRIDVKPDKAFHNKLTKVVKWLCTYDIFYGCMESTQKYYVGEPTKQKNYRWSNLGKRDLIIAGEIPGVRMDAEGEAAFLLRKAYPKPEDA